MTTKWNSRNYGFKSDGTGGNGNFYEHDEQMKEFRRSHGEVAVINGPRRDEAAFLESLLYLKVCGYRFDTGGAVFRSNGEDELHLVPLWKVAGYKLSVN